ncbi:MAG: Na+/H+ antiporter subunit E [Spirochaetales bacterium]|nr:Na+/H+ antiporter subunit E [Spirochaetales bacterium]
MAGWLLFTGSVEPVSLALGFGFSSLIALWTYGLFFEEQEAERRSLIPRVHLFLVFVLVLLFKMYVASFRVLWYIIRGRVNPEIVHFRTRLKSDTARVMLANAITMTPGTVTIDLDQDHLIVHWLEAKTTHSGYAGRLIKGSFEKLLKWIWI